MAEAVAFVESQSRSHPGSAERTRTANHHDAEFNNYFPTHAHAWNLPSKDPRAAIENASPSIDTNDDQARPWRETLTDAITDNERACGWNARCVRTVSGTEHAEAVEGA